ncbi:MAG: universal stress protein [Deltaproteobacteria bacterium]|nr:universal stress protein [Deltaproteobacteria bacterium]
MKILACTDFSAAAAAGEREAARRFPDATLVIFHATNLRMLRRIVEQTGLDGARLYESMTSYADQRMNEVVNRLISQGRKAIAELGEGDPVDLALAAASRHHADLVVMGAPAGEPVGRFRTLLVRKSRLPVLLIPTEE